MREFLSYCEFSNGWIAIDVDEGHARLLASLPFFFPREASTRNEEGGRMEIMCLFKSRAM